jgi:hypothetical protein
LIGRFVMAEPIRKAAPPVHHRPFHARPPLRPRPVLVPQEREAPTPASSLPTEPEPLEARRPRAQAIDPLAEKRLRAFLLIALGLDLGALLLAPSPSDFLLATVVLLAGSAVLAIGSLGQRSS